MYAANFAPGSHQRREALLRKTGSYVPPGWLQFVASSGFWSNLYEILQLLLIQSATQMVRSSIRSSHIRHFVCGIPAGENTVVRRTMLATPRRLSWRPAAAILLSYFFKTRDHTTCWTGRRLLGEWNRKLIWRAASALTVAFFRACSHRNGFCLVHVAMVGHMHVLQAWDQKRLHTLIAIVTFDAISKLALVHLYMLIESTDLVKEHVGGDGSRSFINGILEAKN